MVIDRLAQLEAWAHFPNLLSMYEMQTASLPTSHSAK